MKRGDDDERDRNGDGVGAGVRKRPEHSGQKRLDQARERWLTDPA
jgi:hypothetical protein